MKTRQAAILLVAATGFAGVGYAQAVTQQRYEITTAQVAQALANKGIRTAGLQVSLLAKVVANEPNPELDVLSVEPLGVRRSVEHAASSYMVKVGCHADNKCLPFYAVASLNPSMNQGPAGTQTSLPSATIAAASTSLKANNAVTIRAGAHAVLVMHDGNAQIEVAVVSLENGVAGHTIHVASPDHKQVYLAEVVSATVLTRSF
jgi:hypothetical protein